MLNVALYGILLYVAPVRHHKTIPIFSLARSDSTGVNIDPSVVFES